MVIGEGSRYRLFEAARAGWGDEPAETLMELLPPVGWADVATKADLQQLGDRLRAEFRAEFRAELYGGLSSLNADLTGGLNAVNQRIDALNQRIDDRTRTLFFTILASNATLVALAFAAARIA
jgi:hypothetical protein